MKTDTANKQDDAQNASDVRDCPNSAGAAPRWTIQNKRTGECGTYNSAMKKPVSAEHVRNSPAVKEWANGDPINILSHNLHKAHA